MQIHNLTGLSLDSVYGVIYGIENRNDHQIYIGQTVQQVDQRINNHKIAKTYIGNALRKHKLEDFYIAVIAVCNNNEELNRCEIDWITRLNCKYPNGYNLTNGGDKPPSLKGRKLSPETCAKMSAAHKGKTRPPEVCAKIAAAKIGKPRSPETKAKLSAARMGKPPSNKGKPASLEARAKMSAAKKGKPSNRKGQHVSLESRAKMSAAKKGKPAHNKGIPCAPEVKAKISETLKNRHKALILLKDLGGKKNIVDVTNCATRLRVTVKDDSIIASPATFTEHGAHGLVHNGRAIQVIVGLSVPQVRERFETLLNAPDSEVAEINEEAAEATVIKAVVSGKVIDMTQVPDEMFSQKMMGDGVAIEPTEDTIKAPADAEITMVMEDSKHAVGLRFNNGAEMLIHIGIDTVNLKGDGFQLLTKSGAKVKAGDPLVKIDRDVIKKAGYKDVVVMAITNSNDFPLMKKETGKNVESNKDTVITF